ncbi:MAG: universal stress protein [Rhodocyclaceae bacterium]|nr:universal stress protein [Rhodocyclaceae bacterium]
MKILVAVDGSEHSDRAVAHLLGLLAAGCRAEVHLLNVRIPIESGEVRLFIKPEELEAYYREEGQAELASARRLLDQAGQAHTDHIAVGHLAQTIARYAREKDFDLVIMGTHGRGALQHLLLGSVASQVIKDATVPVTLVK